MFPLLPVQLKWFLELCSSSVPHLFISRWEAGTRVLGKTAFTPSPSTSSPNMSWTSTWTKRSALPRSMKRSGNNLISKLTLTFSLKNSLLSIVVSEKFFFFIYKCLKDNDFTATPQWLSPWVWRNVSAALPANSPTYVDIRWWWNMKGCKYFFKDNF